MVDKKGDSLGLKVGGFLLVSCGVRSDVTEQTGDRMDGFTKGPRILQGVSYFACSKVCVRCRSALKLPDL